MFRFAWETADKGVDYIDTPNWRAHKFPAAIIKNLRENNKF